MESGYLSLTGIYVVNVEKNPFYGRTRLYAVGHGYTPVAKGHCSSLKVSRLEIAHPKDPLLTFGQVEFTGFCDPLHMAGLTGQAGERDCL